MLKLSTIKAPALAGVIREEDTQSAIAEIKNCFYDGADMIDLHMSCLQDTRVETLKCIINSSKLPVSYHAAGVKGKLSRILNPILGGQIAFCVDRFSESSTMEQLDLRTSRTIVDAMKKSIEVRNE